MQYRTFIRDMSSKLTFSTFFGVSSLWGHVPLWFLASFLIFLLENKLWRPCF